MFGKLLNLGKLIYLHDSKEATFVFLLEVWLISILVHKSLPVKTALESYQQDLF